MSFARVLRRPVVQLSVISAAIFGCYWGLWNAYFSQDDYWMFGALRHRSLRDAILTQFGYGIRFLLDLSMWARVKLFDLDAAPYYWVSLIQHVAVSCIVYSLATLWTGSRAVAFLGALLFATAFGPHEVVTWITGSEYSLAAIPYLTSLGLFTVYLRRRNRTLYVGSLVAFVVALLVHEVALSLPFVLGACHLTIGRGRAPLRSLGREDLRLYVPYGILFLCYVALQLWFVRLGSSEARVAEVDYGPGLHVLGNLFYLIHLIVPNVHDAVLTDWFGPAALALLRAVTLVGAVVLNGLAAVLVWKGSPFVRFAVCFAYLTFLPFTLWHARFAGAGRYLYLPAIAFSLLVALGAVRLDELLRCRRPGRLLVPLTVTLVVFFNAVVLQVWVRRHVRNGELRRAVVEDLAATLRDVEGGSEIYIEVPKEKFLDLAFACRLVIRQSVRCEAFVGETRLVSDVTGTAAARRSYWMKATRDGIVEIPPGRRPSDG